MLHVNQAETMADSKCLHHPVSNKGSGRLGASPVQEGEISLAKLSNRQLPLDIPPGKSPSAYVLL